MNAKMSVFVISAEAVIYLLLYNLNGCTFDVLGVFTEWCTTQKRFSLNFMTTTFALKLFSQGSIEQSIKECEKFLFWGNLIKISVSVLNFSIESSQKPTMKVLLFLIAIYSSKNENKPPSE